MSDILADYREWRASLEDRIGTHSAGCHMWPRHERCMIHRLAAALAAEQAKRTPETASTPAEGTSQAGCIITDAEREAIERAIDAFDGIEDVSADRGLRDDSARCSLRGLLERTNYPAKGDSSTGLT